MPGNACDMDLSPMPCAEQRRNAPMLLKKLKVSLPLQIVFIVLIWPRTRKAMQRKSSSVVHETHNQFSKLPKLAPAELSRLKAEKDLKNTQDIAMARKIQDEQIRQNILQREQTQRVGAGLPVRRKIFPRHNILLKVSLAHSTASSATAAAAARPAASRIANTNASTLSATSSATTCPSANGANTTAPSPTTTTPGSKPAPKCCCYSPPQSSY